MLAEPAVIELQNTYFERVEELRLPLVNRFYSDCNYQVKCGRLDYVYSLSFCGKIIAAARLLPQASGHLLLRNLCVAPEKRNQKLATHLLEKIIIELSSAQNPVNCYCFALPHLQNFYLALGFKNLNPEQVPPEIAEAHYRNCARKRGWILMGFINV